MLTFMNRCRLKQVLQIAQGRRHLGRQQGAGRNSENRKRRKVECRTKRRRREQVRLGKLVL